MAKDWQRAHQRDPYTRAARAQGFRARSAFKLKQIDQRFHVLRRGGVVVDLGAAPGGWTQVAVQRVGPDGVVVGVDLDFVQPITGATFVQGDMTARATVQKVLERIAERTGTTDRAVTAVISDMSPNISGTYTLDQARSYHLCVNALRFASEVLKPGGDFVAKAFEGEDFPYFREKVKAMFEDFKLYHPPASRKSSAEIYIVGKRYRGVPVPSDEPAGPEPTEAWWAAPGDDE